MRSSAKPPLLHTQRDLEEAIAEVVKQDPRLVRILDVSNVPPLRRRVGGYRGLAEIVCGQQLSTASAAAIWKRLDAAFRPLEPRKVLRASDERLARTGLSRAKIKTLKAVAQSLVSGDVDLSKLEMEDFESAHSQLTALHGIGPWTADIYLLFCVGHGDAWPSGDLAIQEAVRLGLELEARPTPKHLVSIAETWRPYRGAVAHLWWAYYRVCKQRSGIPFASSAEA